MTTDNQELQTSFASFSTGNNRFGPRLSIKLQENNFLLWNQQVEGIILSHKLHKFVVNPQIPPIFDSEENRIANKVSAVYESWIVQDQALFSWLLSTISESVLPRVLSCKHSYQIWDQIHKHFNAVMKARVHQLRSELKTTKKGTRSISEYVLRIRAIADALLAIGDPISERDQIDSILQGLPEEYNPFVMMTYGKGELSSIYDVEALLYVQEAQLDKYRQELALTTATANLAYTEDHASSKSTRGGFQQSRGRDSGSRGRGLTKARSAYTQGNRPTCQLCGKYGHAVIDCWHKYDENFELVAPKAN